VHRKVVTVLFCDVVGSTSLGESLDPEALQALLARYFERMKGIVESHGGTVEKFIGDAVMAVFGVPAVHEDDALRAVRAAAVMRAALPEVGVHGRIGVNTGEVVTGTEERLAAGDAVNVAARLQQAAEPDEVLLGEATEQLVRRAVEVEPVEPIAVKGKAEPVAAFRLVSVLEAPERAHDAVFVGRERELAQLREAWKRATSAERCELVTVVGDAGVGKSRLVAEALSAIGAPTVRGRCLPYGDGITYWPVVEVVKQLGTPPSDPHAAAAIRSLLGEGETPASAEDIAWAFRKLLEEHAPLAVVFDDLQWGDDRFLDLVEGVGLLSATAPLLLFCMARPEFLARRAEWPAPLRLEPLPDDAIGALLEGLPAGLRDRVAAAAGGNPLFLTEMLAMAGGDDEVDVPPTLRALLAERLDQLDGAERSVLERGAVEGEIFHRRAVQALAPEETQVSPSLAALVRRQLIRPERAQLPGDDGFRFRHLLIRDAAYDALPKSTRAQLHERFADWLDEHGADLVEQDEIVGYHLEQAVQYRKELGTDHDDLAAAAAVSLQRASRAAEGRGDVLAADNLSRRAANLLPSGHPQRLAILPFLVELAISSSRFAAAEEAIAELSAADEPASNAYATILRVELKTTQGATHDLTEVRSRIAHAAETLAEVGDERGLAVAERMLGGTYWMECRAEAASEAYERARAHAERAGDTAFANVMRTQMGAAAIFGPKPVGEALAAAEQRLAAAAGKPLVEASAKRGVGRLSALQGDFARARRLLAEGSETLREAGLVVPHMGGAQARGFIERLAGDEKQAAEYLREGAEGFRLVGDRRYLSTTALSLVLVLLDLGEIDEARKWLEIAAAETNPADVTDEAEIHAAQGRLAALDGDYATAIQEAERAVELAETTDFYDVRASIQIQHGRVLALAGRRDEAAAAFERAREITRAKGATSWTKQIDSLLAEL
jgi:class 3 adenylate cyclase/tetratricopeptide (TPR) repeat protein